MSKPPGRPKSNDPKVAVTLRLPASALARWEAFGQGWRATAETLLVAYVEPPARSLDHFPPATPEPHVDRLPPRPKAPYGSLLKKR